MQSNDLQQEQPDTSEGMSQLRVVPLGFELEVIEKLKKIFQRERQGERTYTVVYPYSDGNVDILFVNYDEPSALVEKNIFITNNCPDAQVVAASQGSVMNETPLYHVHPYQVHGMLLTARILSVFDKVPEQGGVSTNESKAVAKPLETDQGLSDRGTRVLVVDDSIAIQKSIELNLRTLEQITEIDFADSGEKALEKADSKQYDIVFLDVMMPGIDGYETCTRLRKKLEYKHTPVVMVSAKTSPLDEVKGIIAGCTTYLTKPVQDDAFQKLSRRMLVWMAGQKTSS